MHFISLGQSLFVRRRKCLLRCSLLVFIFMTFYICRFLIHHDNSVVYKYRFPSEVVLPKEISTEDRLRLLLNCFDRPYITETVKRGDFWVLKNYIRSDHGAVKCHKSITYVTHADYTYLDNVIPVLER